MKKLNKEERRVIIQPLLKAIMDKAQAEQKEKLAEYNILVEERLANRSIYQELVTFCEQNDENIKNHPYNNVVCKIIDIVKKDMKTQGIEYPLTFAAPSFEEMEDALILAQIDSPSMEVLIANLKEQFSVPA